MRRVPQKQRKREPHASPDKSDQATRKRVIIMTEEKMGENEVFESYESEVQESISVEEAKKQEAEAEAARAAEGE